jgi:hypothetical protein
MPGAVGLRLEDYWRAIVQALRELVRRRGDDGERRQSLALRLRDVYGTIDGAP